MTRNLNDDSLNFTLCECESGELESIQFDGINYCGSCWIEVFDDIKACYETEAVEFAKLNCRITDQLPIFDKATAWSCTPEEYESGEKYCNSEGTHFADCRHNHTNYEELIKNLERDNPRDQAFYDAIRERINELLEIAIEEKNLIRYVSDVLVESPDDNI